MVPGQPGHQVWPYLKNYGHANMPYQVNVLAAKSTSLSSITRMCMVEGKDLLLRVVFWLRVLGLTFVQAHTKVNVKNNRKAILPTLLLISYPESIYSLIWDWLDSREWWSWLSDSHWHFPLVRPNVLTTSRRPLILQRTPSLRKTSLPVLIILAHLTTKKS